jgi:hypothetical protein
MNKVVIWKVIVISLAIPAGVVLAGVITYQIEKNSSSPSTAGPTYWLSQVGNKVQSIITPNFIDGNLTPARDIKGTWISALKGKGIQLFGKFQTGPGVTSVYEDGDMELIITNVTGNTATGTIRYYNLCAWSQTVTPGVPTITVPKQCGDTSPQPMTANVSGTRIDFGSIKVDGASATMNGTFTTNLMSGSMTINTTYGVIKGHFKLMKTN